MHLDQSTIFLTLSNLCFFVFSSFMDFFVFSINFIFFFRFWYEALLCLSTFNLFFLFVPMHYHDVYWVLLFFLLFLVRGDTSAQSVQPVFLN